MLKETCLLLLLVLEAAASKSVTQKGLGRKPCGLDQKYKVLVAKADGSTCGGSLLNTQWILTAAQCGRENVEVTLTSSFWTLFKDKSQTLGDKWQFFDENNNIMLIKLKKKVSESFATIDLPPLDTCNRPSEGYPVQIGGWTPLGGEVPKDHRCETTMTKCELGEGEEDQPAHMCAKGEHVESCPGDTGSAVEFGHRLYGIVIHKPGGKCDSEVEMIDICVYRKWLDDTMNK